MPFNVSVTPDYENDNQANQKTILHSDDYGQLGYFFGVLSGDLTPTLVTLLKDKSVFHKYFDGDTSAVNMANVLSFYMKPFTNAFVNEDKAFNDMKGTAFFAFWKDVCAQLDRNNIASCFGYASDETGMWFVDIVHKIVAAYPDQLAIPITAPAVVATNVSRAVTIKEVAAFVESHKDDLVSSLTDLFESKGIFENHYPALIKHRQRMFSVFFGRLILLGKNDISMNELTDTIFFALSDDICKYLSDAEFAQCFADSNYPDGLWFKNFLLDILRHPQYAQAAISFKDKQQAATNQPAVHHVASTNKPASSDVSNALEVSPLSPAEQQLYDRIFLECQNICQDNRMKIASPLGLAISLGMLYEGLSAEDKKLFAQRYGVDISSLSHVFHTFHKNATLNKRDTENLKIYMANGGFGHADFAKVLAGYDFKNIVGGNSLSTWVAQESGGIVDSFDLGKDVVKLLLNLLAFKRKWETVFDKQNTQKESFATVNGDKIVIMMNGYGHEGMMAQLSRNVASGIQIALLPGADGLRFAVGLPKDGTQESLDEMKNVLANIGTVEFSPLQQVNIKLPTFVAMGGSELNLGQFDTLRSNSFGGSDAVLQILGLHINEEGGEGFVTTATVTRGGPQKFYANRSFAYAVLGPNGDVLMIGQYEGA